jgi:hypothetical protein
MTGRVVEIIITPSVPQYEQLVDDLEALRALGAESNTQAILEAVHTAVAASRTLPTQERKAA